jgi:hypothetical protein
MSILQAWVLKPLACLAFLAGLAYLWLDRNNQLAQARLQIAPLQVACRAEAREQTRLLFEIDTFENPLHLHRLLQQERYRHLHFPRLHDVIFLTAERQRPDRTTSSLTDVGGSR